ncbi:DUF2306 domain-containing protein [Amycolatopsis sp. OK19-0408]|uniref:DUF2306 domain-containing protein n=1 Tax=Amycolatopsis iheyensis TaxID=2945988 RepID=A0A9X2NA91_9PSEU|nr:DUF2306 domain-containing protein [Amycolatopsis iheyensis]MCR6483498.1 DUF2306 domain-containing protein [Amycolatopsis iheyensis]
MLPLAVAVVATLLTMWPAYIDLDPAKASVPIPAGNHVKYPLLVLHVTFGSIALITAALQVWPWLRRRHPAVHRISGRVYIFAGVVPSAAMATGLVFVMGDDQGASWMSRVVLDALWVATTVIGYWKARQGRWAEHRRYMIYSFALTLDVFTARLLSFLLLAFTSAQVTSDEFLDMISWGAWTATLLGAFWWLERRRRSPKQAAPAGKLTAPVVVGAAVLAVVPFLPLDWLMSAVRHAGTPAGYASVLPWYSAFTALALVLGIVQCRPPRRIRSAAIHIHLFGAVLPAVVLGGVLLAAVGGGAGWNGRIYFEAFWLIATVVAYRMARQGRWAEYRRYRVYSLALALDAVSMRLLGVVLSIVAPNLDVPSYLDIVGWCGWIANLVIAHWWLARSERRTGSALPDPVEVPLRAGRALSR